MNPQRFDVALGSVRVPTIMDEAIMAERKRRFNAGQPCTSSDVVRDWLAAIIQQDIRNPNMRHNLLVGLGDPLSLNYYARA